VHVVLHEHSTKITRVTVLTKYKYFCAFFALSGVREWLCEPRII